MLDRRTRGFCPWIRATASREEGPLADLASLLDGDYFYDTDIVVPELPSGGLGIHAPHNLATGKLMGGRRTGDAGELGLAIG